MSTKNTVKVKITLELEVPDKNYAEQGMKQLVLDNFINFASTQCCQESIHWEIEGHKDISERYMDWCKIIHNSRDTLQVEF